MAVEPTEDQVDAALAVLDEEWSRPYWARAEDFTRADIAAGALRAADADAEQRTRDSVRRALAAALAVQAAAQ